MRERLTHLRHVLDRIEGHLESECADDNAASLMCAVKSLGREVAEAEATEDVSEEWKKVARDLFERGIALVDRVKAYADQTSARWFHCDSPAPPTDDDTIVTSSVELYALSHGMPDGATSPPELLAEAARESQMIGRYSTTIPSPPPDNPSGPDTIPEPEEVEPKP